MKAVQLLQKLAIRRTMQQFAAKYHFVYFGSVDARSDEHELVRGVTASITHTDNHYTVGTFEGYDLMLVRRQNAIAFPGKPAQKHTWLIMELDLKQGGLPHIFINAKPYHDAFYANMHVVFPRLQDVSSLVVPLGRARTFAAAEVLPLLHRLMTPDFVATLRTFHQFDYEIADDQVLVYSSGQAVLPTTLTDMLRVGTWLAGFLDGQQRNLQGK